MVTRSTKTIRTWILRRTWRHASVKSIIVSDQISWPTQRKPFSFHASLGRKRFFYPPVSWSSPFLRLFSWIKKIVIKLLRIVRRSIVMFTQTAKDQEQFTNDPLDGQTKTKEVWLGILRVTEHWFLLTIIGTEYYGRILQAECKVLQSSLYQIPSNLISW